MSYEKGIILGVLVWIKVKIINGLILEVLKTKTKIFLGGKVVLAEVKGLSVKELLVICNSMIHVSGSEHFFSSLSLSLLLPSLDSPDDYSLSLSHPLLITPDKT